MKFRARLRYKRRTHVVVLLDYGLGPEGEDGWVHAGALAIQNTALEDSPFVGMDEGDTAAFNWFPPGQQSE